MLQPRQRPEASDAANGHVDPSPPIGLSRRSICSQSMRTTLGPCTPLKYNKAVP